MSVETVKSIEFDGRTYILPENTEIVVKFRDLKGGIHDTPQAADEANGRHRLEEVLCNVVSGYDYELDINELIAARREVIEILSKYP